MAAAVLPLSPPAPSPGPRQRALAAAPCTVVVVYPYIFSGNLAAHSLTSVAQLAARGSET